MRRTVVPIVATLVIVAVAAPAAAYKVLVEDAALGKHRKVRLDASVGAGKFYLDGAAPAGKLYKVKVVHDEKVVPAVRMAGSRLKLSSRQQGMFGGARKNEWEVHLSSRPVWDIELGMGASKGLLDLSGLRVRELDLETGASQLDIVWKKRNPVTLERARVQGGAAQVKMRGLGYSNVKKIEFEGGAGSFSLDFSGGLAGTARVKVQTGAGAVDIKVPKDVGIRVVDRNIALAQVEWPADLEWDSPPETSNYKKARGKIDLDITAAIGRVSIKRI